LRVLKAQFSSFFVHSGKKIFPGGALIVELVRGVPKYLVGRELRWKPRMLEMLTWTTGGVLKKKI
jgi:hypothetical protein